MEVQIVDPEELSNAGDLTADLAETDTVDLIDQSKPHLKPSDLEFIALIFDKIRILYRSKAEVYTAKPKQRFICKKDITKLESDILAFEFDAHLTKVMFSLSNVLKDQLLSES